MGLGCCLAKGKKKAKLRYLIHIFLLLQLLLLLLLSLLCSYKEVSIQHAGQLKRTNCRRWESGGAGLRSVLLFVGEGVEVGIEVVVVEVAVKLPVSVNTSA